MDIKGFKSRDGSKHQYDYNALANKPEIVSGKDGGYYTPAVTQLDDKTVRFDFTPSKEGMPAVESVTVELPVGEGSGEDAGVHIAPEPPEDTSKLWIDTDDDTEDELPDCCDCITLTSAKVGDIARVAAVDDAGVPTAWEAVDFPSGEKWTTVTETITIEGGESGVAGRFALTPVVPVGDDFHEAHIFTKLRSSTDSNYRINWNNKLEHIVTEHRLTPTCGSFYLRVLRVGNYLLAYSESVNKSSYADMSDGVSEVGLWLHWSTIGAGENVVSQATVMWR